ncbi:hypothetical protein HZA43_01700 [Candidatus Peregrinibacteria bacterium]|nr:hypothetical protein [Candidatus Peregrinibacteria bacterium]
MFKKTFVVLDIETTGLYPESDDIIEVACIRYEQGKEVSRFDSLIKIDKEIPPIVSLITTIQNTDLVDAPLWETVKLEVQKIVRGAHIIGHNINFDVGFLKKKGIDFESSVLLDTVPLAQIAFPTAVSHSLESLTDELDIKHTAKHRAMSDTEATLDLFKKIWKKIDGLPKPIIDEIKDCVRRSEWGMAIFFDEIRGKARATSDKCSYKACLVATGTSAPPRGLSVAEVFNENGFLSQAWDHYESRPQQKQMATAVAHAFEHEYHLICEAPTGVGKSLAYLVPAAEIALNKKQRVVIATHTITLQHQLFEKDLHHLHQIYQQSAPITSCPPEPALSRVEGKGGLGGLSPLNVAVLKGRGNYLCLQRLREFKKRSRFSPSEITLLIKILAWPWMNLGGDLADMTLTREERIVWDFELSAASKAIHGGKCCKNPDCYFQQALKATQDAPIVIVNHALLMADLVMGGGLLPEYKYLIIDEAHHFEEVATKSYGRTVTQENLTIPEKSIVAHLGQLKRNYSETLFGQQSCFQEIEPLLSGANDLLQKTDNIFSLISLFVNTHVMPSKYQESLLIDRAIMTSGEWLNLGDSVQKLIEATQEWIRKIEYFSDKLAGAASKDFPECDEFSEELNQEIAILKEQLAQLHPFFLPVETPRDIRFFSCNDSGAVVLTSLPILVGENLKKDLYASKKSILLTSATLSTPLFADDAPDVAQKPFDYLRKMLSLDEHFEELILDSPFDYEKQALMILPTDLPDVRSQDSLAPVAELIKQVAEATQGRMLGLFTSYRTIENLYLNLVIPLQKKGISVLAQRFSGGRNKILRAFLNNPEHSILLGTSSFWEGIDIPGDDLSCVMIHKLPFDIPSDPLHKTRSQWFSNGFYQYTMPRAILRFKQGFGRLIRSKKDVGIMIMLDSALTKKDYGQFFLKSLPNVPVEKIKCAEIPALIKEWLKLQRSDE